MKNLTVVRERITREMDKVSGALQCQRALGGWKDRNKYKCTDLELVRMVDSQEQQLRQYVVKLVVLQEAVNKSRLARWIVQMHAGRIAKVLDAVGPTL